MFLLFEIEIPNGIPKHFMYVPIDKNIESVNNGNEKSEMSGMATSDDLVDYEQGPPGSEMGPPPDNETNMQLPEQEDQEYAQEMEPLKKLFLLQKLQSLSDALDDNNYTDPQLDLVLKYGANLSYNTLVKVSDKLTNEIQTTFDDEQGDPNA
ncbi:MAG: hypothetical protein GY870_16580 [archaeon]|nr:hypothetical protein [archaeon]